MSAPAAELDAYLGELAALLRGPHRRRQQILAELSDGLYLSVADRTAAGAAPAAARAEAIREFGPAHEVARGFTAELTIAYARRVMVAYVVTGPLVGIWWLLTLQPHPLPTGLTALLIAMPVLPLVVIAILTAATTMAATGRLIRWFPEANARNAVLAVETVAVLALVVDTIVVAIYVTSDVAWSALAFIALAASMIRVACSAMTLLRAPRMLR